MAADVLVGVVLLEDLDDPVGNLLKVARGEGEDGGAGAGEADAEEAGLRTWGHALDDLAQAGDEGLAVGLVDLVLHGEVDELRIRGRGAEGDGEEGYSLHVEGLASCISERVFKK